MVRPYGNRLMHYPETLTIRSTLSRKFRQGITATYMKYHPFNPFVSLQFMMLLAEPTGESVRTLWRHHVASMLDGA